MCFSPLIIREVKQKVCVCVALFNPTYFFFVLVTWHTNGIFFITMIKELEIQSK